MKKLATTLIALIPCIAQAEFFSGNDVLTRIESTDPMARMQALGYIQGVSDVYVYVTFCPGSNVTAGQLQDIVKAYLQNNPATRNKTAESLINTALKQVWPCQQRNNGRGA